MSQKLTEHWHSPSMVTWHNLFQLAILLLLAHYGPNVVKRSIWDQYISVRRSIYWRPTTDRPASHLGKFQMAISPWGVVRSTSCCLVLRWGFRGRRIEWRYFRFRQIPDGGSAAIFENPNCDISAVDHPIYSVFGSRMWFSGLVDRMALFPVLPNPRWRFGRHLWKFKLRYLCGGSSNLFRVWFYDVVFGVGASNGANSGLTEFSRYVGENNAWGVIRLVTI